MFYGWRMVAVAFGAHMVSTGLGFYALPRLLVPLAEEFSDGQRAGVSMLVAAISLATVIVGPLVGSALTRFPLRAVMTCGAVCLALGFVAASRASALWQLLVVYATAVPVAIITLSSLGANALVGNWFDRRRPLALGISQLGLAFAGAVVTFFISWTLTLEGGWRGTYLWFAGIGAAIVPLLWLAITDRPSDRGLRPDGRVDGSVDPAGTRLPTMTFADALRDRNLRLVGISAGLAFCGTTGLVQNVHALTTDAGYAVHEADTMFALIWIGAAVGKLLFGWLGVRFGERPALWIALGFQALATALLPAARVSLPLLFGIAVAFGIAFGGLFPALSALLARIYGSAGFGPVLGYMAPMLVPFQILGAPIAAAVNDWTGAYDPAMYGFAAACLVAALLLFYVRIPDDPVDRRGASVP